MKEKIDNNSRSLKWEQNGELAHKDLSELIERLKNVESEHTSSELSRLGTKSNKKDYLLLTDVAKDVQNIIAGGPVPTHIKPIWPFISFTAFHTLPEQFKKIYGVKTTRLKSFLLSFNLILLKTTRPLLPPFFRLIAPARWANQRLYKNPNLRFKDKANF